MIENVLPYVLAVATVIGSALAARMTGRSTVNAAKVTADAEAFTRAKEIYEGSIAELQADNGRIKAKVTNLEARVEVLISSVIRYERRVLQLEGTLRHHRIPVPDWVSPANLDVLRDDLTEGL